MSLSDAGRIRSFNTIQDRLGPEVAGAIMELTNPLGWSDVARSAEVQDLSRRMDGVEHRLGGVEQKLSEHDRRFDRLDDRMDRFEAALREQTHVYIGALAGFMAVMTAVIGLLVHL